MIPLPSTGRRFAATRKVRLGDVDPRAHLRLDSLARYLHDVANDDSSDAGLDQNMGWVVRRSVIDVRRPAVFDETVTLTTACTGSGASCAERRTSVVGDRGADIEAATLWVAIDAESGRPRRLGPQFDEIYGSAAGGRKIRPRLVHPDPTDHSGEPWVLRASDFDLFGHINNAVYLSLAEETIAWAARPTPIRVEVEYRHPVVPGTFASVVAEEADDATMLWVLVDDGSVSTSLRVETPVTR